jgi:hypothetical protein
MFNSKSLTKSKFNLGGITMVFSFFKNKNMLSRHRRKPLCLFNNTSINDLDYFIIFNKHI